MMNVEPIELITPDGIVLRGQHWPGGETWAVLFHEAGRDLDCWQPLVQPLLELGYSLCALDMRGHGASTGSWNVEALGDDLQAAIDYANGHNARQIALIGAGESALPALMDVQARHLFAIVALSVGPLGKLSANELRGSGVPKLLIVGSFGEQAVAATQQIRDRAIGWTVLVRLPTADQGTALLTDQWQLHVQEHTIAFLEEQRQLSRSEPHFDEDMR